MRVFSSLGILTPSTSLSSDRLGVVMTKDDSMPSGVVNHYFVLNCVFFLATRLNRVKHKACQTTKPPTIAAPPF